MRPDAGNERALGTLDAYGHRTDETVSWRGVGTPGERAAAPKQTRGVARGRAMGPYQDGYKRGSRGLETGAPAATSSNTVARKILDRLARAKDRLLVDGAATKGSPGR